MLNITIITATYNSAETLSGSIKSVQSQSQYADHIIIDGASSDATPSVLDKYKNDLVCVISELDQSMYDALNKGINLATGDIIGLLHGDDFYPNENVLSKVISVFDDPDIDACYGDLNYVSSVDTTKIVRKWRSGQYDADKFYWGWMPPHPTFFVRRSVYERYGLFNLDMGTAADYELMLRFCVKHQIKAIYIPEVLVHMRVGGVSNKSIKNRIQANIMDRKAWAVNDLKPYPWTLTMKPLRKIGQWLA